MIKHILVVDDEPRIAEIARDYLERAGYAVTTAANGVDALTIARTKHPDTVGSSRCCGWRLQVSA